MRQSTLAVISFIIVFPFVYLLPYLAEASGLMEFPHWSFTAKGIASFICAGVMTLILTPVNRRILAWRKTRGRDIEAEERHESEHGMISLTPFDKK